MIPKGYDSDFAGGQTVLFKQRGCPLPLIQK